MFRVMFNVIDLIPDWVYGKRWVFGLMFAMALGRMLGRINRMKA